MKWRLSICNAEESQIETSIRPLRDSIVGRPPPIIEPPIFDPPVVEVEPPPLVPPVVEPPVAPAMIEPPVPAAVDPPAIEPPLLAPMAEISLSVFNFDGSRPLESGAGIRILANGENYYLSCNNTCSIDFPPGTMLTISGDWFGIPVNSGHLYSEDIFLHLRDLLAPKWSLVKRMGL